LSSDDFDVYGLLKRQQESKFRSASAELQKPVVALRPWSVSGVLTPPLAQYAFQSILIQAIVGDVTINSPRKVLRRYSAIDDLLALGVSELARINQGFQVLESGGELLDLESLAWKALQASGSGGQVRSFVDKSLEPDFYASDNTSWTESSKRVGLETQTLEIQIERFIQAMASTKRS
jgi:hypothetical protein